MAPGRFGYTRRSLHPCLPSADHYRPAVPQVGGRFRKASFVFVKHRMYGELDIALRSDASQFLGNAVYYGLAVVVQFRLA
jgi:hypothetical protein